MILEGRQAPHPGESCEAGTGVRVQGSPHPQNQWSKALWKQKLLMFRAKYNHLDSF
jgi:hypothetical protein